jgi:H+/Na+-translocating ferredoxin:NAD+ oxidoreductase subunit G
MNEENVHTEDAPKEPSSGRLIATLGIAGFFSGIILVGAYIFTLPMIQANKARALEAAIYKVLPGSKSYETLVLKDGALELFKKDEASKKDAPPNSIFAGYDSTGALVGIAVPAEEPGFQDIIAGIYGYNPSAKTIVGFEVLDSKETPGLGDKIIKDMAFKTNFEALSVEPEIVTVKNGEKKNPNEVEAITGATISSKAVVRLLQKSIGEWKPAIEQYIESTQKEKQ